MFTDKYLNLRLCLYLTVITSAIYLPSLQYPYINYDTPEYIFANKHVLEGITCDNLSWALTTTYFSNWHPLTWISHMIDIELFGPYPGGHRMINITLHILNTILLFSLAKQLTEKTLPSFFLAGLFAIHPLHIQSVVWIAERKDLLCSFFFFLAILSYGKYVTSRERFYYLLLIFFFFLGIMSKPMIITLPVILILLDIWPLKRFTLQKKINQQLSTQSGLIIFKEILHIFKDKIPLLVLSVTSGMITIYAQQKGGAVASFENLSLFNRLANAIVSYMLYLYKTIWPAKLSIIYPHPGNHPLWLITASFTFIASCSLFAFRMRRSKPWIIVGWLWYLITLLPVIGIIQVGIQSMADRYTYIPLTGIFLIISLWIQDSIKRYRYRDLVYSLSITSTLIVLAMATHHQIRYWQNGITLFKRAIEITENNFIASNNLGYEYIQRQNYEMAKIYFKKSIDFDSDFEVGHLNYGRSMAHEGDYNQAIEHYKKALELKPDYIDAHQNIGNAYYVQNKLKDAYHHYRQVIMLDSDNANAYNGLGAIKAKINHIEEAKVLFNKAYSLAPHDKAIQKNLELMKKESQK